MIAISVLQPGAVAGGGGGCVINTDKRSRATVKLNSTDVRDPPSVDTNLLAQQEEVDRMVMCIEKERLYWEELRGLGFNITEDTPGEGLDLEAAVRSHCVVCFCTGRARLENSTQESQRCVYIVLCVFVQDVLVLKTAPRNHRGAFTLCCVFLYWTCLS
jgi:hypothetical protein